MKLIKSIRRRLSDAISGAKTGENSATAVTYRKTPSSNSIGTRLNNVQVTPKNGVLKYPVTTPTSRGSPAQSNGTPSSGTRPSGASSNGPPSVRPASRE